VTDSAAIGRPLPVLEIVQQSYRFLFAHPVFLIATLAVPFAGNLAMVLLGLMAPDGRENFAAFSGLWDFALLLATGVATTVAIVQWHQAVVNGRTTSGWLEPSLYRTSLRYFWKCTLLGLIAVVLVAPPAILFGADWSFVTSVVLILLVRIVLCLPAIASNIRGVGFSESWLMSRGNTFRLIACGFAVALPWVITDAIIPHLPLPNILAGIVTSLMALFFMLVFTSFLSLAYLHLRSQPSAEAKAAENPA
jgi:hypothetical protein